MRLSEQTRQRGRMSRLRRSIVDALDIAGKILGVAQFVAALTTLVCLMLYIGYEPGAMDRTVIVRLLRSSQIVFLATVAVTLLNPEARRRQTVADRLCSALVIITVVPALWMHFGGADSGLPHFFCSRRFLFVCLGIYSFAKLCTDCMRLLDSHTNPSLILSASFIIFIMAGSFVLMLPKCTVGAPLRFVDSLFMATSAVSMTGMSTIDTSATLTPRGWTVMAVLMQIGALGVLTFTSFFAIFFSGNSSLYSQIMMRDFVYSKSMNALVPVILYILAFTLSIELAGAAAIYFTLPEGFEGTWGNRAAFSAFHSLSAFCNCGFSTLPEGMATPELMNGSAWFYIVMSALILAGGIGFPNLVNFREVIAEYFRRLRARILGRPFVRNIHVYDLNTKLVLLLTAVLFVGGAAAFYFFEGSHSMAGMSTGRRIVQSVFCSATVRTAGFLTIGPQQWLGITFVIALFLMWVGCSSQSMGGGIKINAFAAVILNLRSIVFGQKGVVVFGRSIAMRSVRRSNAVVVLSIMALFVYSCLLLILEPDFSTGALVFEAFSALTTVGISYGITPELGDAAKIVLATAMFLGRVGIISVLCGIVGNRPDISVNLPSDDIIVN